MTDEERDKLRYLLAAYPPRVATDIIRMNDKNIQRFGENGCALVDAYEWDSTDQGYVFWESIYNMLYASSSEVIEKLRADIIQMHLDLIVKELRTFKKFDDTRPI